MKAAILARCTPEPMSGCWLWTGSIFQDGRYGRLKINRKTLYAHRAAYEAFRGPIPDGLQIDHRCRNTRCVNPDHLDAVTCRENLRRSPITAATLRAAKSSCPRGHSYSDANTKRDARGHRSCRTCHREAVRRCKARRAA